jgi:hypothetical protein
VKYVLVIVSFLFSACSHSPYQYANSASDFKKGEVHYYLNKVDLALDNNRKLWTSDATVSAYPDQEAVRVILAEELQRRLGDLNLLASDSATATALFDISVNYRRSFMAGSGIMYPYVSFSFAGKDGSAATLVSYQSQEGLLKGGGRKSIMNDQRIMFGRYKQEDERNDIAALAALIVDALAGIAK